MSLAIKPTRRELIRTILEMARTKAYQERDRLDKEWRQISVQIDDANKKIADLAESYGRAKHKKMLAKVQKLVEGEFGGADIYFHVDMLKGQQDNRYYDPNGDVKIKISIYAGQDLEIPEEVRAEMVAAREEISRLTKESNAAYQRLNAFSAQTARRFGDRHDPRDFQNVLAALIPTLGDEAAEHLDALIALVEQNLIVPEE